MAFTGRLGTTESQLGNIVLSGVGSGSYSGLALTASAEIVPEWDAWSAAWDNEYGPLASSITADAIIRGTVAASFTGDAVLSSLVPVSGSISADANILAIVASSVAANAIVLGPLSSSFTANAAFAAPMVTASFSTDAVIFGAVTGAISASAYIGSLLLFHDRTQYHTGTEDLSTLVLDADIERYPTDQTVHTVVADILSRIMAIEVTPNQRAGYLWANAHIYGWHSITADAYLKAGVVSSFTANAVLQTPRFVTANAYIIEAF